MTPDERTQILQQLAQAQQYIRTMLHPAKMCQCPSVRETPLTTLYRVWPQVAPAERIRFLSEMTTPAERRALATGLDDEEETP